MTVYLQNALGFFIQLFPCALLIFLPFPREAYRFSRRTIFICMTGGCAVFAACFSAGLCLRDMEKYPVHSTITNLSTLTAVLLILAAYVWLVRQPVIKKLLAFAVVMFYAVAVFVLVNMIAPFFSGAGATVAYAYNGLFVLLYGGVTALLLPLTLIVVIRPLAEYIREIEPQNMRREFFIVIVSTLFYFVLEFTCSSIYGNESGFAGEWGALQYQILILLLLMLYQVLIYWLIFRESVRRKRDSERRRAMEIQQLQYEKIAGDVETTRRMRHDLRHHYNALYEMMIKGDMEEAREYVSKLADSTARRMNEIYCRDKTVNGLLQYYVGLARGEDIRCDVQVECGETAIEPADLTVVFGNAMENAVNACRKCEKDRWISVQVGTVQGSLAIEISNSCEGARLDRRYQGADGFSPAEAFLSDQPGGGYGLRSIAHAAQKYGGSAYFRFNAEREMFTARIRLNIHADA